MIWSMLLFALFYWFFLYGILQVLLYIYIRKNAVIFPKIQGNSRRKERIRNLLKNQGYSLGIVSNPFAMGYALPFTNRVFLTKKLLDVLTYKELLYIVYHEMGHLKYNHPIKQVAWFAVFLLVFIAVTLYFNTQTYLISILLAFALSCVGRHIARKHEDEADEYALRKAGLSAVEEGISKLKSIYKTEYDHPALYGYFSVHRTHLARLNRLRTISGQLFL